MAKFFKKRKRLTPFQIIILGFAGVILTGALLLMLPISSQSGQVTPFNQALFTATSAVCVTGLVVQDTATYWSVFGQSLILLMIQIGGLGVVTVAASFAMLSGRKISLMQRNTIQEAVSAHKVGGVVRLTGFILKITFAIELAGALALMPVFCRDFGFKGIWMSFFHSISAFCNAGFDLMGTPEGKFASLTAYSASPLLNIVIMLLILFGGLGFLTWDDVFVHKWRLKKYRLQSKVILLMTAILVVVPAVIFFFADFADVGISERILNSLFQAVTPRTAGFNTVDFNAMTGAGRGIIIILMLIGGAPGSTAGGMKTTTIAVLVANAVSIFRRKESPEMFGRRLSVEVVRSVATIFFMYISMFLGGAIAISLIEELPMSTCLFETGSAVATVGLTLGVTPQLSVASQCILIVLMFFGRVGGLTLIYAAMSGVNKNHSKLPEERITVG